MDGRTLRPLELFRISKPFPPVRESTPRADIFTYPQVGSQTTPYENVRFLFPYTAPNTFHAELAVVGETNAIVQDSNSYIRDTNARNSKEYEARHRIYARLGETYTALCSRAPDKVVDECVCSFMTPFDSVNFGHTLSTILDFVHQYRSLGLTVPIAVSSVCAIFPNSLRILQLFFDEIRVIETNKVYHFKKIYMFPPVILDITRHGYLIQDVIQRSLKRTPATPKRKVFLVKLINHHSNVVEPTTGFTASALITRLESDPDWIVLQPETMSIYEIIAYLQNATCIVTSEGSISYGHAIFFDRTAPLYFLVKSANAGPYFYVSWGTNIVVPTDLDSAIQTICALPSL